MGRKSERRKKTGYYGRVRGDYRLHWQELHWWVFLWLWRNTYWRYGQICKAGRAGWFWTGAVGVCLMAVVVMLAVFGSNPRAELTEDLLGLARQYHEEYAAVVSGEFAGTVTLSVDVLRQSGYDVRSFERYGCDGRATNILIRSDNSGGYRVMNYSLVCAGISG